jgi:hypothetical protein
MTISRRREVVETLQGTGEVLKELQVITKVSYSLRIEKEEVYARTFDGKDEHMLDQKFLSGCISPLDGSIEARTRPSSTPDAPLALTLEDGRRFQFEVVEHDAVSGEYRIKGVGSFDVTPG